MKNIFYGVMLISLFTLLAACSGGGDYPKTYDIDEQIEKSDVVVTLNQVVEYTTEREERTKVEFTVTNNRDDSIQFPLSYHFQDDENNLRNLRGYGANDGVTNAPTGARPDAEDEPFEVPANTEASISMDYEGFVDEFQWKLLVAVENQIKTFSFKSSMEN